MHPTSAICTDGCLSPTHPAFHRTCVCVCCMFSKGLVVQDHFNLNPQNCLKLFEIVCNCFNNCLQLFQQLFAIVSKNVKIVCNCFNNCLQLFHKKRKLLAIVSTILSNCDKYFNNCLQLFQLFLKIVENISTIASKCLHLFQ